MNDSLNDLQMFSVHVNDRHMMPKEGGVYFCMFGESVIYIGKTINFWQRWQSSAHHRLKEMQELDVYIRCWVIPKEPGESESQYSDRLLKVESQMIEKFKPSINGTKSANQPNIISFWVNSELLEKFHEIASVEGWRESELHRMIWAEGLGLFCGELNQKYMQG